MEIDNMDEMKKYNIDFMYNTDVFYNLFKARKFLMDAIMWNNNFSPKDKVILKDCSEVLKKRLLEIKPDARIY